VTSPRSSDSGRVPNAAPPPGREDRTISGRWAVLGIFLFAISATGGLYVYWKLHVGPFVPLQKALAEKFPGSRPLVEGGQQKIHKHTPRILRITMKVDADPNADERKTEELAERVIALARERFDLSTYEILEIHFFWPEPEKKIHKWDREWKIADLDPGNRDESR
jgi:hypothetical protein